MAIDDYDYIDETGENLDPQLSVVFVKYLGTDMDGTKIYRFYLSSKPEEVFAEGWGEVPACNVPRNLIDLDEDMYEYILELKTNITLDLAQDCCCFSMQDARDHIIALAYENLDGVEEYPEPRIIIQFGDEVEKIEKMFAKRDLKLRYV